LGLLSLRAALGTIFFLHGYQNLFVTTAETLIQFERVGLRSYAAHLAGVLEMFGGILLLAGLLTRLTALCLALETGFLLYKLWIPQTGIYAVQKYEFPLAMCAAAFALATVGAGRLSVAASTFERAPKSARAKSSR
jgi:putative oxidoreductase